MSSTSMESRIALETRDSKPAEVRVLILDNCRSSTVESLTGKYEELEVLSLINVGLTTLKGFPSYPKLRSLIISHNLAIRDLYDPEEMLELSDNKLTADLEYLKGCSNLVSLKLCNNRITDAKALEPLKLMKELRSLDLIECPISASGTYKDDVFGAVEQLTFLDGIDREGNAEPESDEDYEFEEEEGDLGSDEDVDSEEDGELDDEDEEEEEEEEGDEPEDDGQPASKRVKLDAVPESNGGAEDAPVPDEECHS